MSQYKFLCDASIGGQYYAAGSIASTSDAGGSLPSGWVPGPFVDPLDTSAVNAFWAAGPYTLPYPAQKIEVSVTYWVPAPMQVQGSCRMWQLTGLGSLLPAVGK